MYIYVYNHVIDQVCYLKLFKVSYKMLNPSLFRSAKMNLAKFSEMFDKKKTFRPKKKFQPGTMKYSLHKQAQASLNSGINLRQVVKLPKVRRMAYPRGALSLDFAIIYFLSVTMTIFIQIFNQIINFTNIVTATVYR